MKEAAIKRKTASDYVPPLAALALVVLFTALGFWQLDRADQKRALEESFRNHSGYVAIQSNMKPALYQPISAAGRFLADRQFLIDNMIVDGRVGYYVITPLEYAAGQPLLLVNRGWIPQETAEDLRAAIDVPGTRQTVKGKTGRLPRAAIRPGSALQGAGDWPKKATFPTTGDLAAALDREVLPFVLLADPDPASPMIRRWKPQTFGPMRHIGYAVQWFALALTVVAVTVILYRKKRRGA